MRFSARGEYGVKAIIDVALFSKDSPVQVKEISRRQGIPERFLEQVMSSLKRSGLVESIRGAQGGYFLSRDPSSVSLADVIEAVEGPLHVMSCTSEKNTRCKEKELCALKDVWSDVQEVITNALDSITLENLCDRTKNKFPGAVLKD